MSGQFIKKSNAKQIRVETVSAMGTVMEAQAELARGYATYIGLDVHKETIMVAVAPAGWQAPVSRREIADKAKAAAKLVDRLTREFEGAVLLFCYGALLEDSGQSPGIVVLEGAPLAVVDKMTRGVILVFDNFDAIYAYNHAESYAIAISHLADRLAGYPALRTPWPTDDPGLSRRERFELQKRLVAEGYDIRKVDGRIGPLTRTAVAEHEEKVGWPATGRAGQKVYKALKDD